MVRKIFSGKKIFVLIDSYGLSTLFVMAGIAFIAAVIEAIPHGLVDHITIGSAVIDIITSDAKTSTGATKIMHVLLTVALGWAAVKVYMATAGYRWDAFIAKHVVRRHVVILAGRSAESITGSAKQSIGSSSGKLADQSALAIDIALSLAPDNNVVLHIPGLNSSRLISLWSAGVNVLKDDLELPDLLQATGVKRAKKLIAMRDDYSDNITLTRAALSESLGNSELECKCMIEPLDTKQLFKIEDYLEDDSLARVRVFNESELIARRIVREFPPDVSTAQSNRGVHVLLVGFGSVGQAIAIQLAKMGHYRSGQKPKITIVDGHVEDRWKQTLKMHPTLPDWLTVERMESRIEDVKELHAEKWLQDECPISMVYVCTKDELANLRIARLLLRLLEMDAYQELSGVQVIALDPPGGCILEEFSKREDKKSRFKLFSLLRSDGQAEKSPVNGNLLTEMDDECAKELHKDYCAELEKNPSQMRKPAHKPWEQLAETYREANRSSADHINVKLRAVGRVLASRGSAIEAPLSMEETEVLAKMEHRRWWAERSLDGWEFAEARNDSLKQHPNMLPYEQLDEETKDYDRKNVLKMMRIAADNEKVLAVKSDVKDNV